MNCSNCGSANESSNKFCAECGARLAVTCPGCGLANAPTVKFCPECGTSLAGASSGAARGYGSAAAAGPAPTLNRPDSAAERRLVSVLFADLVGFTGLAERAIRRPSASS